MACRRNRRAWLTTTARRKAIDRIRRSRSTAMDTQQLDALAAQLAVAEQLDDADEIPTSGSS